MLQIRNLKTTNSVLSDVNLHVTSHTVVIGPSGAGKTTLLRCIAGLQHYEGTVEVGDEVVNDIYGPKRNVSIAWQDGRLLPNLSVRKNIEIGGRPDSINELSEMFKITHLLDKYPHELSGGECQRVNILRSLCSPAKIVLLDEPMQGIDPVVVRKVLKQLIHWLNKMNKVAIMVTHELYQVYGLFENAIFIKNGKVVAHDKFRALYDAPLSPWMANFFGNYTVLNQDDFKSFNIHSTEDSCMVRPEWFKIKKPPFNRPIECNARVVGVHWNGPCNKVSLVLDGTKKSLSVEVYTDIDIKIGERVYVNFKKCSRPDWVVSSDNNSSNECRRSKRTN